MRPEGTSQSSLTPDAVGLRVGVVREIEFLDELLGQRSARTFGEDDDLGLQIIARLEIGFLMAFFVDAFVVGANAGDAVAVNAEVPSRRIR